MEIGMKKDSELDLLLKQHTPPKVDQKIRTLHIAQFSEDIKKMDYLPRDPFPSQILTHMSYISCWVWLSQAGILLLIYYYAFQSNRLTVSMLLYCLGPGLSLILVYELSKSFRAKTWEMESACRYNLAQIFFFRLCILFGADFLVLGGALIGYRMTDGPLWQFCLYTLLPFFLTSALSLYALRRIGSRCSSALLSAVPLTAGFLDYLLIFSLSKESFLGIPVPLDNSVPFATLLALALLLYNALRLCTEVHYLNENRKDQKLWNFG